MNIRRVAERAGGSLVTLTGFYSVSRGVGIIAGPVLAGVLIELLGTGLFTSSQGFQAMWIVCAAAAFASLPFLRRMRRHQDEEDGE